MRGNCLDSRDFGDGWEIILRDHIETYTIGLD